MDNQDIFNQLKPLCVPLLSASQVTHSSANTTLRLLTDLGAILRGVQSSGAILSSSLVSYVFFPISAILRRNTSSDIPDQVLEKIFLVLTHLSESWWWYCDFQTWEQLFMLCGAVIGGLESKGKARGRDNETKCAAARCLHALLHERENTTQPDVAHIHPKTRLEEFQSHVRSPHFIPVFGQTLNALLLCVEIPDHELQSASLDLLDLFIRIYAPDYFVPSILPGTTSAMVKIALGRQDRKGWTNGDIVAGALHALQFVISRSLSDDICVAEGAINRVQDLEDFMEINQSPRIPNSDPLTFQTLRTESWLRGTSTQLHVAINSLTPLIRHPSATALHALVVFSSTLLKATSLTLPQTQPLFLSFLLSLCQSHFPRISMGSRNELLSLLTTPSPSQSNVIQTLAQMTKENLSSLPVLISTHTDVKVQHAAGLVEAVCSLSNSQSVRLNAISMEVGRLLGPTGGIEKWSWGLLSSMEVEEAISVATSASSAQLMLEGDPDTTKSVTFPAITFRNIESRDAAEALERMFHALGRAAGDSCIYAIEWFTNVGRSSNHTTSITALWCASRLLEGVAGVSLSEAAISNTAIHNQSKRVAKAARSLARSVSELWDRPGLLGQGDNEQPFLPKKQADGDLLVVQQANGLNALSETLNILRRPPERVLQSHSQPFLRRAIALQIIAISAAILGPRCSSSFIYTLYPVLHSLVSTLPHLSSTAFATLNFITISTSYASPASLLLSNFDYALDAVSRRLTRRWLDVDATKVLAILVRLVGCDVVDRANDVVEECFDRLDDFHGYEIIVEGLVEVLGEVLRVIETSTPPIARSTEEEEYYEIIRNVGNVTKLLKWLPERHENAKSLEQDNSNYGPAPREAWGRGKQVDEEGEGEEGSAMQLDSVGAEPPPTPIQALTKQIVTRSVYFLTHGSPVIRARILSLLSSSVPVLPESALLPAIHSAWPFILNRLSDAQPFVVSNAAVLIEALTTHVGGFMFRRIWDDVWPRFRSILGALDISDKNSALARRGHGVVGTESSYTHSHRLYCSLIRTMTATVKGVHPHESSLWEVTLAFRRFLNEPVHEELQRYARDLYINIGGRNADVVWLALKSTMPENDSSMLFLQVSSWDIRANFRSIMDSIASEEM